MDNTTITGVMDIGGRNNVQIGISALFLVLIMLLAMLGNILVIVAVCLSHSLRAELSNMFIVNLALTDLLSAILVMFSTFVSLVYDDWLFGGFWCDFVCAANYCLIIVSMLTLCLISIDRYQAIVHALHYYTRITQARILAMIFYTWIQGIGFALVPVLCRWVNYDYWEAVCAIQWHKDAGVLYYVIAAFILCFLVPGLVLIFSYCKVLKEACKHKVAAAPRTRSLQGPTTTRSRRSNIKVVRSLMVVVVAYFICLTPFCVTKLIKVIFSHPDFVPGYVNLLSAWFGYASSAVNPLIYGIFRQDFRQVFIRLVRKLSCLKSVTVSVQNKSVISDICKQMESLETN